GAPEFCDRQPANEFAWRGCRRMNARTRDTCAFMRHTIFHANSFAGSSVTISRHAPTLLGKRTITIQAFQDAVPTDDPRNPPASQVERSNIGSDDAAAFPKATR
ncbi:MAG: hypothetical protein ACRDG4_14435, partial [Chloroflexota bacterium]